MVEPPNVRTLLRRQESYAIHALIAIAERPGIPAAAIARQLTMSYTSMTKVLRKLTEIGLIESRRGRSGGVYLRTEPERITLLELVETLSGPLVLDHCLTEPLCATQRRKGHCHLNRAYVRATHAFRTLLHDIHLSDLIDLPGEPERP